MRNARSLQLLAMMGVINEYPALGHDVFSEPIIEIQNKPPKGTKEYFFNSEDDFSTEQMLKLETVFKCCAINDKNAMKKFYKWKRIKSTQRLTKKH